MRSAERIAEYPIREYCGVPLVNLLKQTCDTGSIDIRHQSTEPLEITIDPLNTMAIITDGARIEYNKNKSGVCRLASPVSEPGENRTTYIASKVSAGISEGKGGRGPFYRLTIVTNRSLQEVGKTLTQALPSA
ncbi:MAG: hypothetical protein ACOX50_03070 [Patescibacteria group bacterium]|jgi:hypothetical protein